MEKAAAEATKMTNAIPQPRKFLTHKFRIAFWRPTKLDVSAHEQGIAQLSETFSKRPGIPVYASRSMLEGLTLLHARSLVWGIKAVVIDYTKCCSCKDGNWQVVGFATGTADRDEAAGAIASAAHRYAKWIMVDDADPRANGLIAVGQTTEGA